MIALNTSSGKDGFIKPSQLCIGLFVYLDVPWTDHPFTFSSFKIKSLEQIEIIQGLGLQRIRYSPKRSDSKPLALSATEPTSAAAPAAADEPASWPDDAAPAAAPATTEPAPAPENTAQKAKLARLERVASIHTLVAGGERELLSHARTFKSITGNVFAQPEAAGAEAQRLVESMAQSALAHTELAIHLMSERVGSDDINHHAMNVAVLSMMLAREMKAPDSAVRLIGLGALFHDIGKIEVPQHILRKTTPLTRAEQAQLQQHCATGVSIGERMHLPSEALVVIAQHHENVDGSGYPRKLQGTQISLLSRIVALANAYEVLCNPVFPGFALTPHDALSTLWGQRRNQFDATAMQVFVRCMGVYPPGTAVMLSNGTIGMVVAINATRAIKPMVMIYDPAFPKEAAMVVDLEQESEVTISKTLHPDALPKPVCEYLSARKRMCYYIADARGHGGS